jgi:hypothetical protein
MPRLISNGVNYQTRNSASARLCFVIAIEYSIESMQSILTGLMEYNPEAFPPALRDQIPHMAEKIQQLSTHTVQMRPIQYVSPYGTDENTSWMWTRPLSEVYQSIAHDLIAWFHQIKRTAELLEAYDDYRKDHETLLTPIIQHIRALLDNDIDNALLEVKRAFGWNFGPIELSSEAEQLGISRYSRALTCEQYAEVLLDIARRLHESGTRIRDSVHQYQISCLVKPTAEQLKILRRIEDIFDNYFAYIRAALEGVLVERIRQECLS